jgi:hypothetical protein
MSSDSTERMLRRHDGRHVPLAELDRLQGAGPIVSVDELVRPGIFESGEELDEFLADLYASCRVECWVRVRVLTSGPRA